MKTEEAIKIIQLYINCKGWSVAIENLDVKEFKEIITLLKRGEAYEAIVEEFKNIFYTNPHNWVTKEYYADEIKKLEQKYFPKEAKQ